jgi:phosphoglycolate phosphatase
VIDYYRQLGFDFTLEPFFALSTEFMTEYNRRWPECHLRAGAREILQQAPERGLSQSILSASEGSYLQAALGHFELRHLFVTASGLDNHHAFGKLEIGRKFMAEHELEPGEILFIGDTRHDAEVAQAMGVDCWLIPGGHQSYQRLTACGARLIGSFAEFKNGNSPRLR